jgi:hypothetical protein
LKLQHKEIDENEIKNYVKNIECNNKKIKLMTAEKIPQIINHREKLCKKGIKQYKNLIKFKIT